MKCKWLFWNMDGSSLKLWTFWCLDEWLYEASCSCKWEPTCLMLVATEDTLAMAMHRCRMCLFWQRRWPLNVTVNVLSSSMLRCFSPISRVLSFHWRMAGAVWLRMIPSCFPVIDFWFVCLLCFKISFVCLSGRHWFWMYSFAVPSTRGRRYRCHARAEAEKSNT